MIRQQAVEASEATQALYARMRRALREGTGLPGTCGTLWGLACAMLTTMLRERDGAVPDRNTVPALLERAAVPEQVLRLICDTEDEAVAAWQVGQLLGDSDAWGSALHGRSKLIRDQIGYMLGRAGLDEIPTPILDYGCGVGGPYSALKERFRGVAFDAYDPQVDPTLARTAQFGSPPGVPECIVTTDRSALRDEYGFVLVNLVLHHTEDPWNEFQWIAQRRPRLVIVIESVLEQILSWELQALVDWIGNRALHPHLSVPVPGSFRSCADWVRFFAEHGYSAAHVFRFGLDCPVAPEDHAGFVLLRDA